METMAVIVGVFFFFKKVGSIARAPKSGVWCFLILNTNYKLSQWMSVLVSINFCNSGRTAMTSSLLVFDCIVEPITVSLILCFLLF